MSVVHCRHTKAHMWLVSWRSATQERRGHGDSDQGQVLPLVHPQRHPGGHRRVHGHNRQRGGHREGPHQRHRHGYVLTTTSQCASLLYSVLEYCSLVFHFNFTSILSIFEDFTPTTVKSAFKEHIWQWKSIPYNRSSVLNPNQSII